MKYSENCIYAVQMGDRFKVGYTSRLGDRLSEFQREAGALALPKFLITGLTRKKAQKMEREVHAALGHVESIGEKFSCVEGDLRAAMWLVAQDHKAVVLEMQEASL